MHGFPQISWEEIYRYWSLYADRGPVILNEPIRPTEIHVDFKRPDTYIYGYDWLSREEYLCRKKTIEKNPTEFLYFTQPTNKGTIHTLRMLMDAKDDEERAAIWIYAFAKELSDMCCRGITQYLYPLCTAASQFLSERYYLWHHAMKRLVPEVFINHALYSETEFRSFNAVIELVRLNAALLLHEYVPILYSSLEPGEHKADYSVRR
ncbi:MAG: hypothetical protein KHX46_04115 [Clostridiales bacterium]|nr:hypothetical protein [Clostridiales bacterium]